MSEIENSVSGTKNVKRKKKKTSIWFIVNGLYILGTILFGWVWCLITIGITFVLLPFQIIISIALAIVSKKHRENKKLLYTLRAAAIAVTAVILLSPLAILKFENTRIAYPVKKAAYSLGVGSMKSCWQVFPVTLPKNCEDYTFITEPSTIAQDYHPSAYLIFHSNSDTLKKYETQISSLYKVERYENTPKNPEDYYKDGMSDEYKEQIDVEMKCPDELPRHVYYKFCNKLPDDLENAVVYRINSTGCMFNYETGLAVFWV